jgi:integrase
MKQQRGQIFKVRRREGPPVWYGRWRRDEIQTNAAGERAIVRKQHCEQLAEYSDRYRSKKDVQPLLDQKLRPENEGRSSPESTLSVADYAAKHFLPYADRELKPSTTNGYRSLWKTYLSARLANVALRDLRCVDATNILAAIHRDHGLSRKSLRHCKALMSTIFTHAKRAGVLDGSNPVTDAGVPKAARASAPTHAYTADEVFSMLSALTGVARGAIGLMYFCGLRPGEARAARWDDYDEAKRTLRVRASRWRTFTTTPKTEESSAVVPVAEALVAILRGMPRHSEYILAGPSKVPADLHNLARRTIVPALKRDESLPTWHGWYALRRGLATIATSVDSPLAAKSLLRHTNIQTTAAHYIKSVPAEALRAISKVDALFERTSTDPVN